MPEFDADGYQILPIARPVRKESRPSDVMPQWTENTEVPPSAGGPWTDLHAAVAASLADQLAKAREHGR
jgi:hypothetical protein